MNYSAHKAHFHGYKYVYALTPFCPWDSFKYTFPLHKYKPLLLLAYNHLFLPCAHTPTHNPFLLSKFEEKKRF